MVFSCREFCDFLKHWREEEKKTIRHPIVDILPWWVFILILVLFCAVVTVLIFLVAFSVIPERRAESVAVLGKNDTQPFLAGQDHCRASINSMGGFNQELGVAIRFKKHPEQTLFGFTKDDLTFSLDFHGTNEHEPAEWILIHDDTIIVRSIECKQGTEWCEDVQLEWFPHIEFMRYKMYLSVVNGRDILPYLSDDTLEIVFDYTSKDFSVIEVLLRYILFVVSACVFVFFVGYTFFVQLFKTWLLEQRVTALLLFALMFYNNPFFVLDMYVDTFVFPLINVVFLVSFVVLLMFTVLVLIHATMKKPSQRSFLNFYAPKLLLCVVLWLLMVFGVFYIRFRRSLDSMYRLDSTERTVMMWIGIGTAFAFLVYFFTLAFYLLRSLTFCCTKKLPPHYSGRIRVLFVFTILIVIGSIVDAVLIAIQLTSSGLFLLFFVGYNLYCYLIAIFYLPSHKVRSKEDLEAMEETFQMQDDLNDAQYARLDDDMEDGLEGEMELDMDDDDGHFELEMQERGVEDGEMEDVEIMSQDEDDLEDIQV